MVSGTHKQDKESRIVRSYGFSQSFLYASPKPIQSGCSSLIYIYFRHICARNKCGMARAGRRYPAKPGSSFRGEDQSAHWLEIVVGGVAGGMDGVYKSLNPTVD